MRRTRAGLVVVGAVALAVTAAPATAGAGGGGGGEGGGCLAFADAEADATEVVLRDFCLEPVGATATPGATITVTNAGEQPHTYTAVDGSFDTGVLDPGESTTVEIPDAAGTLPVYCTLHASPEGSGMAGTMNLVAAPVEISDDAGTGLSAATLAAGLVVGGLGGAALRRRRPASLTDPVDG